MTFPGSGNKNQIILQLSWQQFSNILNSGCFMMTILDAKTLSFSLYLMKTQWLLELLVVYDLGNSMEEMTWNILFLKQM